MAKCAICNCEIPRGQKYKGVRYKNISVCSEACYNALIEQKENAKKAEPYPDYNSLMSYISNHWFNPNWVLTAKAIKSLVEKQGLTCKKIRGILRYAIEIEGEPVNQCYGLGQFIPKYIEPYEAFIAQIKANMESAKDMKDEIVVVRKPVKQQKFRKEEEWD